MRLMAPSAAQNSRRLDTAFHELSRRLRVPDERAQREGVSPSVETPGEDTLLNLGVRHWMRRERVAIDISLQRARGSGFVIGLSCYGL
jgi:hypothetical protein